MLTKHQAAVYCGIGVAAFLKQCPVVPTAMGGDRRVNRYDVRLLDTWIDSFVPTKEEADDDYWIAHMEKAFDEEDALKADKRQAAAEELEFKKHGKPSATTFTQTAEPAKAAVFMKVREVAERLMCSEGLVRKMIASGELESVNLGLRMIRIPRAAVDVLVAGRR